MTVGDLKKKLELYRDDAEIFVGHYDDLYGTMSYHDPFIFLTEVEAFKNKLGHVCYELWAYRKGHKHTTVLVIE